MRRFTLVELMIVVAIIGILAGIAIPNMVAMQVKAKEAEVPAVVDGVTQAIIGQLAADDDFASSIFGGDVFLPDETPGKTLRDWPVTSYFDVVGFRPDGQVRGSYRVDPVITGIPSPFTTLLIDYVVGIADADEDGDFTVCTNYIFSGQVCEEGKPFPTVPPPPPSPPPPP